MKGLKSQNLRDHMTDLELIFSMLGEASTTAIVKTKNPTGFKQNKVVAREGGKIAGDARKALELKTGEKVISEENYLPEAKKNKELYCKWDINKPCLQHGKNAWRKPQRFSVFLLSRFVLLCKSSYRIT